jgi:hypothetical protein
MYFIIINMVMFYFVKYVKLNYWQISSLLYNSTLATINMYMKAKMESVMR